MLIIYYINLYGLTSVWFVGDASLLNLFRIEVSIYTGYADKGLHDKSNYGGEPTLNKKGSSMFM